MIHPVASNPFPGRPSGPAAVMMSLGFVALCGHGAIAQERATAKGLPELAASQGSAEAGSKILDRVPTNASVARQPSLPSEIIVGPDGIARDAHSTSDGPVAPLDEQFQQPAAAGRGTTSKTLSINERLRMAEEARGRLPKQRPDEAHIKGHIVKIARELQFDEKFATVIAQTESGFDPFAVSEQGAVGVMQLMPGTARDLGVTDPFDAEANIRGGIRYLKQQIGRAHV